MPIARTPAGLVYYAHVPKCGGSSVEEYLRDRFGPLALLDRAFTALPGPARWSATSPQHIDAASLARLFPGDFFAGAFAVVRHPAARAVSAFHFQIDVEKSLGADVPFSQWLRAEAARLAGDPFTADNHFRPQSDFLPEGCAIFHLEHGLDAIIPWLDALAGDRSGPRFVGHDNPRQGNKHEFVLESAELALIEALYAEDFARLGYRPGDKLPLAAKPEAGTAFRAVSAAARARAEGFLPRLKQRLRRRLRKWLG